MPSTVRGHPNAVPAQFERNSQVELNINRRNVLAARLQVIAAQIDLRRAEANELAAQGTMAGALAELHAFNEFERRRLEALQASGALNVFSADPGQPAGTAQ